MSEHTKKMILIAVCLVVAGLVLFIAAMFAYGWDFSKLGTVRYVTNEYDISEYFSSVSVDTKTADIEIVPSGDGACHVVCHEAENEKHSVKVEGDTLVIKEVDTREWYGFVMNFGTPKVTVYLPKTEYASFVLKTTTGDILVSSVTAGALDINATTGDVEISDFKCIGDMTIEVTTGDTDIENTTCRNLTTKGSTGDVSLDRVAASEKFFIERTTGDIDFEDSDAYSMFIKTTTGDVEGNFLTAKSFEASSTTGDISVPRTYDGGRCEIITTTGDIEIEVR